MKPTAARLVLIVLLPALVAATDLPVRPPSGGSSPAVRPHAAASRLAPPVNSHLHGVTEKKVAASTVKAKGHGVLRRYDAVAWITLHRGTATVVGVVHDGKGEPVAGASVRLRDRHGHPLRSTAAKHITTSGSSGTFVMTRVRAGAYKLVAWLHKSKGGQKLSLHSGQVARPSLKM